VPYTPEEIRELLDRVDLAAERQRRAADDPAELDAQLDEETSRLSAHDRRIIGRFLEAHLAGLED